MMTFLVIRSHFLDFRSICAKRYISPVSKNLLFPPVLQNFTPDFVEFTCFNMLYVFLVSPYFDHVAFMYHTMHVGLLDDPDLGGTSNKPAMCDMCKIMVIG